MCIIPVDFGDLITTLTLRYKLFYKASISSGHFTGSVAHNGYSAHDGSYDDPFTNNVGIHAIDYAELYIGGTLIEKSRVIGFIYTINIIRLDTFSMILFSTKLKLPGNLMVPYPNLLIVQLQLHLQLQLQLVYSR